MGSVDQPFNLVSVALGAEATFVGRALIPDRKGLSDVLRASRTAVLRLVEIYQDCPIFNDGSFDVLRKEGAEERMITVRHGEPITFGADGELCVVRAVSVWRSPRPLMSRPIRLSSTMRRPTTPPTHSRCRGSVTRTSSTRDGDFPTGRPARL